MKKILQHILLFAVVSANSMGILNAQNPNPAKPNPMANFRVGKVYGKVLEKANRQPVPFASVQVLIPVGKKDSLLGGGLTEDNGEFSVGELAFGRYKVKISAIGFKEIILNAAVTPGEVELDMGDLALEINSQVLKDVEVTAEKTAMQLSIDKKVFNVDKNLASQGGTADQVLRNVPSVNVDNDGNAQLRNQATTIYVDGRPTFLALNQIPADQIDQVEVITNPSAKFEASATGGIINLVMKKNKKTGYNGMVAFSGGTYDRLHENLHNTTLNINARQGKWNVFVFGTLGGGQNTAPNYTNRTTLLNGTPTSIFEQTSIAGLTRLFQNYRAGFDYSVNNRNTLTLAGNMVRGKMSIDEDQVFNYLSGTRQILGNGYRTTDGFNEFQRNNLQLTWKRTYAKKGKELVADLNTDFGSSHNENVFLTRNFSNAQQQIGNTELQKNIGDNKGTTAIFQLDYVNPLNDSTKLEWGVRNQYQLSDTKLAVDTITYNENPNYYKPFRELSNHFEITNLINAAYVNYTSKYKGWGYAAGFRYEQSNFFAKSLLDAGDVRYDYPSTANNLLKAIFPSLFLSKKLNPTTEIQFNMSRKLNRPNFMQVLPIVMFADRFNIRIGNPNLRPEFVNIFEFNYNKMVKNVNVLMTAYWRNTDDPITQYADLVLPNGQQRTTFVNGTSANSYGLDNTLKIAINKHFDVMMNANIFNVAIESDFGNRDMVAWNGKTTATYKLPKDWTLQLNGGYNSRQPVPQGFVKSNYGADFSLRKDFSRFTSLNFSVNDIFDTRRIGLELDLPTLQQDQNRRRETRSFRLTFTHRFGKADASMFKRPTRRPQQQQEEGF